MSAEKFWFLWPAAIFVWCIVVFTKTQRELKFYDDLIRVQNNLFGQPGSLPAPRFYNLDADGWRPFLTARLPSEHPILAKINACSLFFRVFITIYPNHELVRLARTGGFFLKGDLSIPLGTNSEMSLSEYLKTIQELQFLLFPFLGTMQENTTLLQKYISDQPDQDEKQKPAPQLSPKDFLDLVLRATEVR